MKIYTVIIKGKRKVQNFGSLKAVTDAKIEGLPSYSYLVRQDWSKGFYEKGKVKVWKTVLNRCKATKTIAQKGKK